MFIICTIINSSSTGWDNYVHAGTDKTSSLEKIPFARIINGILVYDSGESASTIYTGLYIATYDIIAI